MIIDIIDDGSLEAVNRYLRQFGVSYSRDTVTSSIGVRTAEKGFKFWDRIMRVKPGFDRGENEKKK